MPVELEDGVIDFAPTPKKPRINSKVPVGTAMEGVTDQELNESTGKKRKADAENGSPSKKRRVLEEEGVVLMDSAEEVLEQEPDYILIDD